MSRSRIIGIGSHHGIDQTGWWLCELLKKLHWDVDIEISTCTTPTQLLSLMHKDADTILLDYVQTNSTKEQILTLQVEDLCNNPEANQSCHGFGVAEALQLSYTLGHSPSTILILGVCINKNVRNKNDIPQKIIIDLQQKITTWLTTRNQKPSNLTELNGILHGTE